MESNEQSSAGESVHDLPEAIETAASDSSGGAAETREYAIVKAKVVRLAESAAVVSFGWKTEGLVPFAELGKSEDGKPAVKAGDEFEVLVEALGETPEQTVLSKEKAEKLRTWDRVASVGKGGQIEGTVAARVPGGYSVDVGMRAFLPSSQASLHRGGNPDAIVGQKLTFTLSEFDKRRGNIVLSRRSLLEKEEQARKQEAFAKISEGALVRGTVKSIADYGAFLDVGGVDGLLHVTEMSWGRIGHPREVLKVGQQLDVKVIKFNAEAGKIGLSLKQTQEDPWARVAEKYPPKTVVSGKVVSLTDYGAFVAVEPGVEGLVHVSELSWTRVKHPAHVLQAGQQVQAMVLEVDSENRRLRLGMRQLQPNPWSSLLEKYPVGTVLKRKVKSVTDFGVFLEIEEGIDGLVHISELDWGGKVKHPGDLCKPGDEVEAKVLDIDVENERFALSIKQLKPDPWTAALEAHPVGSRFKGKVTRVADFGAFVEIEPGIEGLVHISELSTERVESVASVVKPGDEIEVQVIDVRARDRKVSLSVRALTEVREREEEADYREHLGDDAKGAHTTLGDVFGDKLRGLKK